MPGKVVTKEEWLAARKELLVKEKEVTRVKDELARLRSTLPMEKVDQTYTFTGPDNKKHTLKDLFEGRKQLITYHFMLAPSQKTGCTGCSFLADNLPSKLAHLHFRSTTLALVSRAPIDSILAFQKRMGWEHIPWYSSLDSSFNQDFQATLDAEHWVYNYREVKEGEVGERPGMSVFLLGKDGDAAAAPTAAGDGEVVYHSYSAYQRGVEGVLATYGLLDITPLGRQEDDEAYGGADWLLSDEY